MLRSILLLLLLVGALAALRRRPDSHDEENPNHEEDHSDEEHDDHDSVDDELEVVEHHSLDPPFISDWWLGGVPHWDFGGSTVITNEYIRVAPDKQSRIGWLWNEQANFLGSWELEVGFRIHSKRNPGADGLAIWYCEKPYKYDAHDAQYTDRPNLWGNSIGFKGVGFILDTYDNDAQRDNPVLAVIKGDGNANKKWEVDNDLLNQAALRCVYEFRNTRAGEIVQLRANYNKGNLQVYLSTVHEEPEHHDPEKETYCGSVSNIKLPPGWFFGITATTGHLADNHDVHWFSVTAHADDIAAEDHEIYGDEPPPPENAHRGEQAPHTTIPASGGKKHEDHPSGGPVPH